jgi:hypothetical protein
MAAVLPGKRRLRKAEVIMDLHAVAAGPPVATVAQAVSHLTGRQIVPALVITTVLLLALAILFGPGGPLSAPRRPGRLARTIGRPVQAADLRDRHEDFPCAVPDHAGIVVHDGSASPDAAVAGADQVS